MKNNNIYIIDTHAHLYDKAFINDINGVIIKIKSQGIGKVVMPTTDVTEVQQVLSLQQKDKDFFEVLLGIHPGNIIIDNYGKQLSQMEEYLSNYLFTGIGEIGLDYHSSPVEISVQKKVFERQLSMARAGHFPLSIHTRDAFEDTYNILRKYQQGTLRGVIHCFSGTYEQAMEYINLGFKLGIGGVVTFKNSKLADVLKNIPISNIVLETDSPYLTPEPFRGQRNDCSYLNIVVDRLCDVYNISRKIIIEETMNNSNEVFMILSK